MNLKEYLFYSGISVREFAKIADINESYLSSILSGNRIGSKRMLKWIESASGGWVKAENVCAQITYPEGFPIPIKIEDDWDHDADLGGKAAMC